MSLDYKWRTLYQARMNNMYFFKQCYRILFRCIYPKGIYIFLTTSVIFLKFIQEFTFKVIIFHYNEYGKYNMYVCQLFRVVRLQKVVKHNRLWWSEHFILMYYTTEKVRMKGSEIDAKRIKQPGKLFGVE